MADGSGPRAAVERLRAGTGSAGDAFLVMYALGPEALAGLVHAGTLRDWVDHQRLIPGAALAEPVAPADRRAWLFCATREGAADFEERLGSARDAFAEIGDALAVAFCWWRVAEGRAHRGDSAAVVAAADAARASSSEPTVSALALHAIAMERLQYGHVEVARDLFAEASRVSQSEGPLIAAFLAMSERTFAERRADREQVLAVISRALRGFEATGHARYAAQARIFLARCLVGLDRPAEAVAHLEALPPTPGFLAGARSCGLGEAALCLGDPLVARQHFAVASAELTPASQFRALIATGDLRAAALTETLDAPGPWREVASSLREVPGDEDVTVLGELYLARAWALPPATGAERLATWAEAHGDQGLVAASAGLDADRAMAAGKPGVARVAIDRAMETLGRLGPQQRRRTELQACVWEVWYGTHDPARVRGLLELASRAGDAIGEALARVLLARGATSDAEGAAEGTRAFALADARRLGALGREAAALAWVWGGEVARPDVSSHDLAFLVAAGDVRRGDLDALAPLAEHLGALPPASLPHLLRLASAALGAAGLLLVRAGPPPAIRIGRGRLWIGEVLCDFGRAHQLLELFEVIATRGDELERAALFEEVWKGAYRGPSSDNALQVSVMRLRARLGGRVTLLPTRLGGFRLAEPALVVRTGS